jgi:regulator of sigma E protease
VSDHDDIKLIGDAGEEPAVSDDPAEHHSPPQQASGRSRLGRSLDVLEGGSGSRSSGGGSPGGASGGSGAGKGSGRGPSGAEPEEKRATWGWILLVAIVVALLLAKWTLLIAILGLAFLITVHEFGHFIMAKKLGMRVERFFVGFPPALWKRRRGETEYGIGMIPLGGFCKISGMSEEEELADEVLPRAYFNQPVWKRNVVIAAGPVMNILAAVLILFVFLLARGTVTPTLTLEEVVKGTPGAQAGLVPGDTLLSGRVAPEADGQTQPFTRFQSWDDATAFFRAHPEQAVELRYRPAGGGPAETVEVELTRNPSDQESGYLGVRSTGEADRPAPWTAAWMAVKGTGDVIAKTFQGFWWLMSGRVSATGPEGAVGPVGIVQVSAQAVQQDLYPVLLAFISVNLGILNLIPILPFDGGHIFFNTLESIRGRKVSSRVMERAAAVGVVLLLTLFVFLTFNDIRRLFGVALGSWLF